MMRLLSLLAIAGSSFILRGATAAAVDDSHSHDSLSPIYTDNTEYLPDVENIVELSWDALSKALAKPDSVNSSAVSGFDWTKPYPGSPLAGHGMHLTVARDVPVPEDVVQNATTTVSSLTFSIPDSIMSSDGVPAALHPSWYICRHVFIVANNTKAKAAVEAG